jgi:hypothetical protein
LKQTDTTSFKDTSHFHRVTVVAWASMLTVSSLMLISWRTFGTGEPNWWPQLIGVVLLLFASSTLIIPSLRPLRGYLAILSACYFLGFGGGWQWGLIQFIRGSQSWVEWAVVVPWWASAMATHILRLTPALMILIYELIRGKSLSDVFLVKGNTAAPVESSKLLGIKKPESWMRVGSIFAIVFFSCTLVIMLLTAYPTLDIVFKTLPLIPNTLLVAAINSFNEEFTLRAAPLAELMGVFGKQQSLLITTVYFGLGHYYGIPSGAFGVLLASFLGWFIGKSILETRGFAWAWLIHFLPDAIIFAFLAMSATV